LVVIGYHERGEPDGDRGCRERVEPIADKFSGLRARLVSRSRRPLVDESQPIILNLTSTISTSPGGKMSVAHATPSREGVEIALH
jgi:hypothetical protein